jgi:hypothetical protein
VLGVLLVAAGGTLWVRYRHFQRTLREEIQAVIDLEAKAWAEGDTELFLSLQDKEDHNWYFSWKQAAHDQNLFVTDIHQPARVTKVDPWGDTVWVEVEEEIPLPDGSSSSWRRAHFYRHTESGWKHTGGQDKLWGEERNRDAGPAHLVYRARDEAYIDELARWAQGWYEESCQVLDCSPGTALTITLSSTYDSIGLSSRFWVEESIPLPPGFPSKPEHAHEIAMPSFWHTGLPSAEAGEAEWDKVVAPLRWQMAYALAAQRAGLQRIPEETSNQWCLLGEVTTWLAEPQRENKPPLLQRIVEKRGLAVIPDLLHQLKDFSINDMLADWLDLRWQPGQEVTDFQSLLDLEQEALHGGFRDTFLALQDPDDSYWRMEREMESASRLWSRIYDPDHVPGLAASPQVQETWLGKDYALVGTTQTKDGVSYRQWAMFRRVGKGWLRAAPVRFPGSYKDEREDFWGEERTYEDRHIKVVCREADEPFVLPVIPALDAAVEKLDEDLGLEDRQAKIKIEFIPYLPVLGVGGSPYLLVLESPLTTGVRADGEMDEMILRQAVDQMLSRHVYQQSLEARMKLPGRQFESDDMNAGWSFINAIESWEMKRLMPEEQPVLDKPDTLCTAWQEDALLPLDSLWPFEWTIWNSEQGRLAWMEAHDFVEFLVQRQGSGVTRALLDGWARAESTAEWVQAAVGEDMALAALEEEWRQYLGEWCRK